MEDWEEDDPFDCPLFCEEAITACDIATENYVYSTHLDIVDQVARINTPGYSYRKRVATVLFDRKVSRHRSWLEPILNRLESGTYCSRKYKRFLIREIKHSIWAIDLLTSGRIPKKMENELINEYVYQNNDILGRYDKRTGSSVHTDPPRKLRSK